LAQAATWIAGRTTPNVKELVTVDETGEDLWLYGSEDIAGDGETFNPPEPNLDIRTAYATSDASRFWARTYVSDANAPGANVLVFVFIDADNNATTGESAASLRSAATGACMASGIGMAARWRSIPRT